MARAAVIPQSSPAKRTTRTRTKGSTTSTSTKPAPKTTKAKAPSSATEARKRGVRTTSAATSKPVEDDSDESTDDEIGMVDEKEKVKTTKGRPATKAATSTTGRRGRKPAKVDLDSDNDDELAQSDAPKKRAGRPRTKPVSTPAKPETVAPKARGRPKGSTAATKAAKPVDPVKENTRLNAKGFTDLDFSSSQDAPRRVFIATNSVSSAARSNLLRGPAKKKKVTFQDPFDSAGEEVSEEPSPPPAAGRRRGTIGPGRQAGLASKPVRKTAATTGRGRKPAAAATAAAKKKDGPKPLSPKKATQVAKALSSYANSDSEDDELSGEKDQIKFVVDSSAKHGSEKTGLSSPVKKINLTEKYRKSLDENGEPLPGPRRSIDFNDTLLMSSPARRPPPSPFNFTMRETPKRGGFALRDDAKQLSQPHLSPTHNSPLKLSPRKAHLETPKRSGIFLDGGNSLSQPNFTPGRNSPLKSSPRKGLFGASFTSSQAHAESTATPLRHSVSFLQSPAKKIASPFKSSLFASRSTIKERPTAEDDVNVDAPATPDVEESPLRMTDFEKPNEVEREDEQVDDAPVEELDALDTTKDIHARSPAIAELDDEVESEDEQVDDASPDDDVLDTTKEVQVQSPAVAELDEELESEDEQVDDAAPEEVDALDATRDIHAQSPAVAERLDEEDTLHEEFDREETIEYEQEANTVTESVAAQDEHTEGNVHAVQDAEEAVDEAAESEDEVIEEPLDEPMEDLAVEPVEEPVEDIMDEPLEEAVQEPVDVPMDERTEDPVEEPTEEPMEEPVEEPMEEPMEEPVDDLIDEPAEEPTREPVAEPADEPIDEPTELPMEQPVEEPVEAAADAMEAAIAEPVEEPMEDPMESDEGFAEEVIADPIDEPVTEPVAKPVQESDSEQVQSTVEDLGVSRKSDVGELVEDLPTEHADDNADSDAEPLAVDDRESTVEVDDASAEQAKGLDQVVEEHTETHGAQDETSVAHQENADDQSDHEVEEEVDEKPKIKYAQNPGLRHSLVEGLEDVFVERSASEPVEDVHDSSETEDDPDMLEAGDENATDIFDDFDDDVSENYPFDDGEPTLVAVEPTEYIPPNPQPILPYEVEEPEGSYSPTRQIYYTKRVLSPVRFIESPVRRNVRTGPSNYEPAAADSDNEVQDNNNLPDPFVDPRQATPRRRSTRRLVLENAPRFTPLAQQFGQWKASSPAKAHPKRPRRGVFSLGGSKRSSNVTAASEVSYPDVSSQAQSSSSKSPMPEASNEADVPEIYEDKDQEQEPQALAGDTEVVESSGQSVTEVVEDIPAPLPVVDASEDKENAQEKVASVTDSPVPASEPQDVVEPQAVVGPPVDEDKENEQEKVASVPESPVPASEPRAVIEPQANEDKENEQVKVASAISSPTPVSKPQADEDKENEQEKITPVPESPVAASKSQAEDKMNGNIPVLAPFTPMKNRISQMQTQTVHTVSKVPLKPEGEISPLKISRKRGLSFSAPSPRRSSRPRLSTFAPVEQNAPSISPRKSPRLQRAAERQSPEHAQAPSTAKKAVEAQAPASHKRPAQSPNPKKKSKTPRTSISAPKLALQGAVAYVDVHTTEGEDASGIFIELLQQMGARCVKNWSWNPRASVSPEEGTEPKEGKVGITHVIYKDGGVRTLEKVRHAKGLVKCVGVGWVLDCERENKWLDESHYEVDLSIIPRGGAKRRKSMEPRALSNINGTLVKAEPATNRRRSVLPPKDTSSTAAITARDTTPSSRDSPATPDDTPKYGAGHSEADQDFCHTPKTPGYTIDMDAIGMSPATPFYLSQRTKLVQQTCPPKQTRQGLFTSATPAREPNQKLRAKLEAARRKSMAYKPRVGSPLV
ncbi:hypothetical protein BO94DRAFT_532429, partial [Aspergillus sclerotioniger CBS 115572]